MKNDDDIFDDEEDDPYGFPGVTITAGTLDGLNKLLSIPKDKVIALNSTSVKGNGMYKVGVDIESGTYSLTATNSIGGYCAVYDTPGSLSDMTQNDNFEGNAYITVDDGQYLEIDRCTATLS
jgi:hypothetical protein